VQRHLADIEAIITENDRKTQGHRPQDSNVLDPVSILYVITTFSYILTVNNMSRHDIV
jgi:hypothetical protein